MAQRTATIDELIASYLGQLEARTPGSHALRPAEPLQVTFGFYSPSISFCYPGGEGPLGSAHGS